MTVLFVVLAWLLVVVAIVVLVWKAGKQAPDDFEREIALAELEGDPQTDPQPSSGGAHGPLPSEAGRASPKHLDLPRLG